MNDTQSGHLHLVLTGGAAGSRTAFFDRLTRWASHLGLIFLDRGAHADGRDTADIQILTDQPRRLLEPPPRGDAAAILLAILHRPVTTRAVPSLSGWRQPTTLAQLLRQHIPAGTALPPGLLAMGIASMGSGDPGAIAITPALLIRSGHLPDGLCDSITGLTRLLGCLPGATPVSARLDAGTAVEAIRLPSSLIRLACAADPTAFPPPAPPAAANLPPPRRAGALALAKGAL